MKTDKFPLLTVFQAGRANNTFYFVVSLLKGNEFCFNFSSSFIAIF